MPWRPMTPQDLGQVQVLADAIHADHPEDAEVLAERQRLYPQGCLVLVEAERVIGYAITHPWRLGEPPPLNTLLGALPGEATTYYIHDVALLPEARSKGYASQVAGMLVEHAKAAGFGNLSLVAVNHSRAFWESVGFRTTALQGLEAKLASYGPDSVLMMRDLTSPAIDA